LRWAWFPRGWHCLFFSFSSVAYIKKPTKIDLKFSWIENFKPTKNLLQLSYYVPYSSKITARVFLSRKIFQNPPKLSCLESVHFFLFIGTTGAKIYPNSQNRPPVFARPSTFCLPMAFTRQGKRDPKCPVWIRIRIADLGIIHYTFFDLEFNVIVMKAAKNRLWSKFLGSE
jgi:hypothetical protein